MIISGLWTHFGYADESDVPDCNVERSQWMEIVEASFIRRLSVRPNPCPQNSASFIGKDKYYYPTIQIRA